MMMMMKKKRAPYKVSMSSGNAIATNRQVSLMTSFLKQMRMQFKILWHICIATSARPQEGTVKDEQHRPNSSRAKTPYYIN